MQGWTREIPDTFKVRLQHVIWTGRRDQDFACTEKLQRPSLCRAQLARPEGRCSAGKAAEMKSQHESVQALIACTSPMRGSWQIIVASGHLSSCLGSEVVVHPCIQADSVHFWTQGAPKRNLSSNVGRLKACDAVHGPDVGRIQARLPTPLRAVVCRWGVISWDGHCSLGSHASPLRRNNKAFRSPLYLQFSFRVTKLLLVKSIVHYICRNFIQFKNSIGCMYRQKFLFSWVAVYTDSLSTSTRRLPFFEVDPPFFDSTSKPFIFFGFVWKN